MKEIGDQAFLNCTNLTSVSLNEGLEKIGMLSFQACSMESITFPSTLLEVCGYSFCNCSHLGEVIMNETLETVGERAFYRCLSLQGFKFPDISIRLENIIEAGQTEVESKVEEAIIGRASNIVWSKGEEMFVPGESLRAEHPRTSENLDSVITCKVWWYGIKQRMDKIVKQLSYHEMKEATTLFELALWKEKIDHADDTSPSGREACRIEVPGPVKDIILQYLGYT